MSVVKYEVNLKVNDFTSHAKHSNDTKNLWWQVRGDSLYYSNFAYVWTILQ